MEDLVAGCTGRKCDYAINAISGEVYCVDGGGDCGSARMLSGAETKSHDADLEAATKEIQKILDGLQDKANGRKLSFLNTDEGMFLAWVDHSKAASEEIVRRKDGHDKVAEALGIS